MPFGIELKTNKIERVGVKKDVAFGNEFRKTKKCKTVLLPLPL